jgi:hypothetical protein
MIRSPRAETFLGPVAVGAGPIAPLRRRASAAGGVRPNASLTSIAAAPIFAGVNLKTAAGLSVALVIGLALAGCASNTQLTPMGDNTYTLTRQGVLTFTKSVGQLKAEAREAAADFCEARGKQLKVLQLTAEEPHLGKGVAKATIVFQAVDAVPAPAPQAAAPAATGDRVDRLYSDLKKLDELRQQNILTNDEFQGEKKKVLDQPQ